MLGGALSPPPPPTAPAPLARRSGGRRSVPERAGSAAPGCGFCNRRGLRGTWPTAARGPRPPAASQAGAQSRAPSNSGASLSDRTEVTSSQRLFGFSLLVRLRVAVWHVPSAGRCRCMCMVTTMHVADCLPSRSGTAACAAAILLPAAGGRNDSHNDVQSGSPPRPCYSYPRPTAGRSVGRLTGHGRGWSAACRQPAARGARRSGSSRPRIAVAPLPGRAGPGHGLRLLQVRRPGPPPASPAPTLSHPPTTATLTARAPARAQRVRQRGGAGPALPGAARVRPPNRAGSWPGGD